MALKVAFRTPIEVADPSAAIVRDICQPCDPAMNFHLRDGETVSISMRRVGTRDSWLRVPIVIGHPMDLDLGSSPNSIMSA